MGQINNWRSGEGSAKANGISALRHISNQSSASPAQVWMAIALESDVRHSKVSIGAQQEPLYANQIRKSMSNSLFYKLLAQPPDLADCAKRLEVLTNTKNHKNT